MSRHLLLSTGSNEIISAVPGPALEPVQESVPEPPITTTSPIAAMIVGTMTSESGQSSGQQTNQSSTASGIESSGSKNLRPALLLRLTLKDACVKGGWTYAVFWRTKKRAVPRVHQRCVYFALSQWAPATRNDTLGG